MKICKRCWVEKDETLFSKDEENKDGLKRYCKDCCRLLDRDYIKRNPDKHRDNARAWMRANPQHTREYEKAYREKYGYKLRARQRLRYHVSVGNIVKGKCVVCGDVKVEGHHEDYSKPLEVIWLCKPHHEQVDHGIIVL